MKQALLEEKIESLLSSIKIGLVADKETKGAFRAFAYGDNEIAIITKDNNVKYQKSMDVLYKHIHSKEQLISYNFFEQVIHRLIIKKSNSIINTVLEIFDKIPTREFFLLNHYTVVI